MTLRSRVTNYLECLEAGRSFKRRLALALSRGRANDGRPVPPQRLAHLRFIHVEPSFLCNLECQMCPRLVEGHKEGLMPRERFERLAPIFPYLNAVVLTGFGEPVINPHLPEFIAMIRGAGALPCMSTNGTLLDERRARAILEAGVFHVQFSIDAGTSETFERIRVGAKWDRVLANAQAFHELVRAGDYEVETGWVFILMRDTWRELPVAVEHAARIGFKLFTAKLLERNVLDFERSQDIHDDAGQLLVDEKEFRELIAQAQAIAERAGMRFVVHDFFAGYDGACLADPLHSVFVDWMGYVTPCCHLPVRSEFGYHPEHVFGNVDEEDIVEILTGPRATEFLRNWQKRVVPWVCRRCHQVRRLPDRHLYRTVERLPI